MKTEDKAWRDLQNHASAQLHNDFADRVLRYAQGPQAEQWQALRAHGAAQLRPGFAERVIRAARGIQERVPSLFDRLAFGAATVAVCIAAVVFIHHRQRQAQEAQVLASWQQFTAEAQVYGMMR
jgi:hypothetical protein